MKPLYLAQSEDAHGRASNPPWRGNGEMTTGRSPGTTDHCEPGLPGVAQVAVPISSVYPTKAGRPHRSESISI